MITSGQMHYPVVSVHTAVQLSLGQPQPREISLLTQGPGLRRAGSPLAGAGDGSRKLQSQANNNQLPPVRASA